jgi:hypothetical protein
MTQVVQNKMGYKKTSIDYWETNISEFWSSHSVPWDYRVKERDGNRGDSVQCEPIHRRKQTGWSLGPEGSGSFEPIAARRLKRLPFKRTYSP